MPRLWSPAKVNARIAAGRSVLTRTVVNRDESRLHRCILDGDRPRGKPLACVGPSLSCSRPIGKMLFSRTQRQ